MTAARRVPTCWIIAGPNGAGKTTFALEYLPNAVGCRQFVAAAVSRTVCFFNAGQLPEKVFTQRGEDCEVLKPALFWAMMEMTA